MTNMLENAVLDDGAIRSVGVPQRELRLVVDGLRGWLDALTRKGSAPGFLGVIEGEPGQGQAEILSALRGVCRDLSITALWARCAGGWTFAQDTIGDLIDGLAETIATAGGSSLRLANDLEAEMRKVCPPGRMAAAGAEPGLDLPRLGPELEHARFVDAIARCFIEASRVRPVLLLIEGLENLDVLTAEVLRHLCWLLWCRRLQSAMPRVLVIVTTPPGADIGGLIRGHELPWKDAEAFRIETRGYGREDLRDLAQRLLGEDSKLSFRERVYKLSNGNARHMRWLFLSLQESGGHVGSAEHLSDADLAFEKIVERRVSALTEAERDWVQVLCALNRPCAPQFIAQAVEHWHRSAGDQGETSPAPAATLEAESGRVAVESLVAKGWVGVLPSDAVAANAAGSLQAAPRLIYLADPEVGRTVLEGLDRARRQSLHRCLGRELERLCSDDERWLPHVYYHLRLAGESGASRAAARAVAYLERVGFPEAALEIIDELLEEPPAWEATELRSMQATRALLLLNSGHDREARDAYSALLSVEVRPGERSKLWRVLGDLHGKLKETAQQIDAYTRGLSELDHDDRSIERLNLLSSFARVHLEAAELDASFGYLEKCLELLAALGLSGDKEYCEVYRLAQEVHFRRADYVEAADFEEFLLKKAEEEGDVPGQLRSLRHLAYLHRLRGEWKEAEGRLLQALRIAKASGSRLLLGHGHLSLGLFKRESRDASQALRYLRQAAALFADIRRVEMAHKIRASLIGLEFELGQFEASALSFHAYVEGLPAAPAALPGEEAPLVTAGMRGRDAAASEKRRLEIRKLEKRVLHNRPARQGAPQAFYLAQLLEDEGRLAAAQRVYSDHVQREVQADSLLRCRAALARGRIARLQGNYDAALRAFEQALEIQGSSPIRAVLAECYLEVSYVLLERGDLARAFEYTSRGLRASLEVGARDALLKALLALSTFFGETGLAAAAIQSASSAVLCAEQQGDPFWETQAHRHLLRAMVEGASSCVSASAGSRWGELLGDVRLPVESCQAKLELGWDAYLRGDYVLGLKLAREGIETAREIGMSPALHDFLHLLGVIESAASNPSKNFLRAIEALEQALQGAEAACRPRLRWEVLIHLARVYRERGKADLAEEYERRAEEIYSAIFSGLPLPLRDLNWTPLAASTLGLEGDGRPVANLSSGAPGQSGKNIE